MSLAPTFSEIFSSSLVNMTAVARADMRNIKLPSGSWDSHVHVIDEVNDPTLNAGFV
jgi:hypothetical protein